MNNTPSHNLKVKDLSITQQNTQSLCANKLQVINYLERKNTHIALLSELWIKLDEIFIVKNYELIDQRRIDGYGGAGILIKNNIAYTSIVFPEFKVINAVGITTKNLHTNINVISVYVPSKKRMINEAEVRQDIINLMAIVKKLDHCLVGGDFNAFHCHWGSHYHDVRGLLLVEELSEFCLLNDGSPTRVAGVNSRSNPLDLTWITRDLYDVISWEVKNESLGSDHLLVSMSLQMTMFSEEILVKEKIDYKMFQSNIETMDVNDIDNLADFIIAIESKKTEAIKQPKKITNPKFKPKGYWNDELKKLHREKKYALIKYFRKMNVANLLNYKNLNALFKRKLKFARKESFRLWAESLGPDTPVKEIFRSFKRLNNYRVPNQPNVMFNHPDKVEAFLQKICKTENPSALNLISPLSTEPPFTLKELNLVLIAKVDSSPGIDSIRYSTIMEFPMRIKEKFLELVNLIWASQDIPKMMKEILVVLIPKPGRDLSLLSSQRPIALLSVYLKVINAMIKVRMEGIIEEKQIFDPKSYGFIRHRSAINCVNHLISIIKEKQEEGLEVMAVFIDLEDAFTNVNLRKMQSFMNRLGMPMQYSNWILNAYQERELFIDTCDGGRSCTTNEGIPQGDVLSPMIFLLYTTAIFQLDNDNTEIFQFADDLVVISWDKSLTSVVDNLQRSLNHLIEIVKDIDMSINSAKTKAIWFKPRHKIFKPIVKINGVDIEFVPHVKYLGIYLDEFLNYKKHIMELLQAMDQRMNIIKMFAGNKWGGHPKTLLIVLKSVVRSRIDYGCSVYGSAARSWLNKIDIAYNRGLRICLRALKTTPINALLVEAGSVPLQLRREFLTKKEILKTYQRNLPMASRFGNIGEDTNGRRLTFMENISCKIKQVTNITCKPSYVEFPSNLRIVTNLVSDVNLRKKDLNSHQWKKLAEKRIEEVYSNYKKIYTDASKKDNGRIGMGMTDCGVIRKAERGHDLLQISNGELFAILMAIIESEKLVETNIAIFTDSLNGCKWLESGLNDNYIVHFIRGEIGRIGKNYVLQWIPSHVGVFGNEEADILANQGTLTKVESELKITFSDAICEFKNSMIRDWQSQYEAMVS